jgi:hypothetical protein
LSQCQALQLLPLRFDKELNPLHRPQDLLLWLPLSQLLLWLPLSLWQRSHQWINRLLCLLNPFQHHQTEWTQ